MKKRMGMIRYFLFFLLLVLASCGNSFLDTRPTDKLGQGEALSVQSNVYAALNGIYRKMVDQYMGNQACGGEPSVCILRDCLGEDVVIPDASNGYYVASARWTDHRDALSIVNEFPFSFYYYLILQSNLILEAIGGEGAFHIPVEDTVQMRGIRGETLCFRAWAHFQLLQLYGHRYESGGINAAPGITYRTSPRPDVLCRNSVADCYALIHRDLDSAIYYLRDYTPVSVTHISQKVAYGIKARVAQVQQDYAGTARYASLAIQLAEKEGFRLMEGEECLNGFSKIVSRTREALWAANTQDDQTIAFFSFYAYMSWNFNSGAIRVAPRCVNSLLYAGLADTDIRRKWWDPTGKLAGPTSAYKKYAYQNRKFEVMSTTVSAGDFAYMRLAELYLMKAEALARGGEEEDAREVLRDFVVTRDPAYVLSGNSGKALTDEIMMHRRTELWGEGFRFTDLKRLNAALDRNGTNYPKTVASVMEIPAGDVRWQWLIPESEVTGSLGIVEQND